MLVNDVKKGTRVMLECGWEADIADNKKGMTRLAKVYGIYTEMGSVYAKDIKLALIDGNWVRVELSPAQAKQAAKIARYGF